MGNKRNLYLRIVQRYIEIFNVLFVLGLNEICELLPLWNFERGDLLDHVIIGNS